MKRLPSAAKPGRGRKKHLDEFLACAVGFLWLFVLSGCGADSRIEAVSEAEERHYQRGRQLLREGREEEALAAFLRVIDARRDAPESHLEAGRLYHEQIGDPVAAIYHYRRFIELRPSAEQTPLVQQMIETAQKDFARSLPAQPFQDHLDRLDLLEIIGQLRRENDALKTQVAELRRGVPVAQVRQPTETAAAATQSAPRQPTSPPPTAAGGQGIPPAATQPRQPSSGMRTYRVQEGDTLSRISTQVYGSSARWTEIFEANRDQLPGPHSLRPGQELRIP